jgi:hypothetical protein
VQEEGTVQSIEITFVVDFMVEEAGADDEVVVVGHEDVVFEFGGVGEVSFHDRPDQFNDFLLVL